MGLKLSSSLPLVLRTVKSHSLLRILPILQVCDRYAYSGVAYSSAKGLDKNWCKSGDVGLPRPDCIIFMDMPVDKAAERGQYGEERYEKLEFQREIQGKFFQLKEEDELDAKKEGRESEWLSIDATQGIDEIHKQIKTRVDVVIEEVADKPIGSLWTDK